MTTVDELRRDEELALKAATIGSDLFEQAPTVGNLEIHTKETLRDVVTTLDLQIEQRMLTVLRGSPWPTIGEETSAGAANLEIPERAWFADPVDGTANFTKGLPFYGSSVGLVAREEDSLTFPVGAIYLPKMKELLFSSAGTGFYFNGRLYRRTPTAGAKVLFGACLSSMKSSADQVFNLLKDLNFKTMGFLRQGSAAVTIANVALGRLGGALGFHVRLWDVAGGLALAEAAGCKVWCRIEEREFTVSFIVGDEDFVSLALESARAEGLIP